MNILARSPPKEEESATNQAQSQKPGKPQKLAKWRQEEIENQKKLIRFLMTPTKLRGEEEAQIQLNNIRDSMKYFTEMKISDAQLIKLLQKMQYEYHGPGQDVITHGDKGDKFYLIIQGSVSIHVPKNTSKSVQESADRAQPPRTQSASKQGPAGVLAPPTS